MDKNTRIIKLTKIENKFPIPSLKLPRKYKLRQKQKNKKDERIRLFDLLKKDATSLHTNSAWNKVKTSPPKYPK